jgi:hypothetical protein
VGRWLTEYRASMGKGFDLAQTDTRTANERLRDIVLTVVFPKLAVKASQGVVVSLLAEQLAQAGFDATRARFILSNAASGIAAGIDHARRIYETADVARWLRICAAVAEVEEATRKAFAARQPKCASWKRFEPPPADELEALIWLQRLHWGAGGTFYLTLWNTVTDERNLVVALKEFNLREWKRTGFVTGPAKRLLDRAELLFRSANSVVPPSGASRPDAARDSLNRLLDIYRLPEAPRQENHWIVGIRAGKGSSFGQERPTCIVAVRNPNPQPVKLFIRDTATGLKYRGAELEAHRRENPGLKLPYGLGIEMWNEGRTTWTDFGAAGAWAPVVAPKTPGPPAEEVTLAPGETLEFWTFVGGGLLPVPQSVRVFITDTDGRRIEERVSGFSVP